MSIPELLDDVLPEGIYETSLSEVLQRFAYSSTKRAYLGNLIGELYDVLWRAGGSDLVIGGSFITAENEPRDIDCAILIPSSELSYFTQRWDREDLVHIDIKLCQTRSELRNWYGFLQLDRAEKKFKGVLKIEVPSPRPSPSEEAWSRLVSEPLLGKPRGTFSNTPREEKIDVIARDVLEKLEEQKKRGEGISKKIAQYGYAYLKKKDPTGGLILPEDFDKVWPDKRTPRDHFDFSDFSLKQNELAIIQITKNHLRQLPPDRLDKMYHDSIKKSDIPSSLTDFLDKIILSEEENTED